jgi:hypothetical protein
MLLPLLLFLIGNNNTSHIFVFSFKDILNDILLLHVLYACFELK